MKIKKEVNKIFISVIIPLYNKAEYIIDTLNSVKNQSYKNFEIIIINDGSTDNSLELVSTYEGSKITIINQVNQGVSVARNNGIEAAKGEFIAFLDADDYWYTNHLELLNQSIKEFPNEVVFCSNYEIYITKKNIKKTAFSFNYNSNDNIILLTNYFKSSLLNSIAWTSAVCIKKSILDNSMLFDQRLICVQDTDLWIRLGLKYSFVFNITVTAKHYKFIENSLSKIDTINSKYIFSKKYIEEEKNNPYLKKYMDNNRYAIAMDAKERGLKGIYLKLREDINNKNLNFKQLILLHLHVSFIKKLKKIFKGETSTS